MSPRITLLFGVLFALRLGAQSVEQGPKSYPAGVTLVPASGAVSTLTTNGAVTVPSGATVNYQATGSISLEPGFTVANGGIFHAELLGGAQTFVIIGGNNQTTNAGQFTVEPFDVAVWNSSGTQPVAGVAVTFSVQSGGGLLATTNLGSPSLLASITLNTDVDGTAQVFYRQPGTAGVSSQITATSGVVVRTFSTQSAAPGSGPSTPSWLHTLSTTPNLVRIGWGSSTSPALAGYYIYRDGIQLNTVPVLSLNYTDATAAPASNYTYTVRAVDTAGNLSSVATLVASIPVLSTSGWFEVFVPSP